MKRLLSWPLIQRAKNQSKIINSKFFALSKVSHGGMVKEETSKVQSFKNRAKGESLNVTRIASDVALNEKDFACVSG